MIVKEKKGGFLNFEIEENGIYAADCLLNYEQCGYKSVDAIITDLPYGTTQNKWDAIIPFDELWKMADYVLKPNGVFITTSMQPFTSALIMSNPKMFKYNWVWKKSQAVGHLNAWRQPMRNTEDVCVFYKKQCTYNPILKDKDPKNIRPITNRTKKSSNYGNHKLDAHKCPPDKTMPATIIEFNNAQGTIHPTQKPLALVEYLVKTYTNKGDMVFDPTAGSGTTAIACEKLERDYICFENDIEMCNKANERLNAFEKSKERGLFSFTDNTHKAD